MGSLFAKPVNAVNSHDRAVLNLKTQRDRLHKYTKTSEGIIAKDTLTIKRLLKENQREKALLVLKRRKYQENLLEKNQKLQDNIQEMVDSIQFAQMEANVFNSLKQGAASLKEIHKQINLGELEDIMMDTEEGIEKQKEIDELLSGCLSSEDEEDILAELEQLKVELGEGTDVDVTIPNLPEVPVEEPGEIKLPDVPEEPVGQEIGTETPKLVAA